MGISGSKLTRTIERSALAGSVALLLLAGSAAAASADALQTEAQAQVALERVAVGSEAEPDPTDPAADAVQEAVELAGRTGDYREAAERLVREADALQAGDPAGVEMLVVAGRLYHHGDDLREAYGALRRAGQLAYVVGMPARAAHTFLDAAQVAQERGRGAEAREAADMAGFVLRTAPLTSGERDAVLARVTYATG